MADYKLKLDIDEKELAKKIERALKGAKIDTAIFGDGPGGGSKQVKDISKTYSQIEKTITIMHKTEKASKKHKIDALNIEKQINRERIKGRLDVERESKVRQKMNREMAGYNTLLRQATGQRGGSTFKNIGGLFGGRAGAGLGGGLDAISPMFKLMKAKNNLGAADRPDGGDFLKEAGQMGKTNRVGAMLNMAGQTKAGKTVASVGKAAATPVKLAGFMAGMAGAAGFGKMIIDSSPVLQAMLKLLNVGIMLILRPIGDFIGFMLRPLLIEFVKKVAIPAYRSGAKIAKEWGTKLGEAILNFFVDPIGTIVAAIKEGTAGVLGEAADAIGGAIGSYFLPSAYADGEDQSCLTPFQQLQVDLWEQELEDLEKIKESTGFTVTELDKIHGIFKCGDLFLPANLAPGAIEGGGAIPKECVDGASVTKIQEVRMDIARWEEEARKIKAGINSSGKSGAGPYGDYANEYHAEGGAGRPQAASDIIRVTDDGFDRISRILAKYNEYRAGNPGSGSSSQSSNGAGYDVDQFCRAAAEVNDMLEEGLISAEEAEEKYQEIADKAALSVGASAVTFRSYKQIESDARLAETSNSETEKAYKAIMLKIQAAKAWVDQQVAALRNRRKADGSLTATAKDARAYGDAGNAPIEEPVEEHGWQVTLSNGKVMKFPKPPGLSRAAIDYYKKIGASVHAYAAGGIITEPILGIGQNSGRQYSFGEAGPETVTPGVGGSKSSSGGNTYNVTINAGNITRPEQLKPLVLRWLKESTSRVGIV